MANIDAPMGATNARHMLGGGKPRTNEYPIASAYAANIIKGDFVKLIADGTIQVAAAGNRLLGVFSGVQYTDASGNVVFSDYWPTGTVATDIKATVVDDPYAEFAIQCAGTITADDVGQLADHVAGTGSVVTKTSGHEVSATTGTAAAGLRILGKVESPDNDWGANANVRVQIVEHELTQITGGTPGV